ncbi:hypothetical protein [Psychrobacillus sp. OK032]|nr:hypothetical protein [Psychrobacillus sp. OK032]SER67795.1 hypothetical protein SAMN05518872_101596 [Psychrobacillus sp. OK032]
MRAWTITQIGEQQDALKLADIQKPHPKADEALIHVKGSRTKFF